VAVEVLAPPPVGALLAVHHRGTFELQLEHVREQQALATARFVEDLVSDRPDLPVVLLGDLNADPDAASIRFLTGKQSLAGTSVRWPTSKCPITLLVRGHSQDDQASSWQALARDAQPH
jgi:endonuclease/exonuclease/phosphatase family metal-dependent hydrolase